MVAPAERSRWSPWRTTSAEGKGFGRCRMQVIPDASGATLDAFVTDVVEPGAHVVTDGWGAYRGLTQLGYTHEPRNQSEAKRAGTDISTLLPGVPGRLPRQAVAGLHAPGIGRTRASAGIPRRVCLPIQ